jgi:hypothetical protein
VLRDEIKTQSQPDEPRNGDPLLIPRRRGSRAGSRSGTPLQPRQHARELRADKIMLTLRSESRQAADHCPTNTPVGISHRFHDGGNRVLDLGLEPPYNPASECESAAGRREDVHLALRDQTGSESPRDGQPSEDLRSIPRWRESLPGSRHETRLRTRLSLPKLWG